MNPPNIKTVSDGRRVFNHQYDESWAESHAQALRALRSAPSEPNLRDHPDLYATTRGVRCKQEQFHTMCTLSTTAYTLARPVVVRAGSVQEPTSSSVLTVQSLSTAGNGEAEKQTLGEAHFGHLAMHVWSGSCAALSPFELNPADARDGFSLALTRLSQLPRKVAADSAQRAARNMESAELQDRDVVIIPLPGPMGTHMKSEGYRQGEFGHGWTTMDYSGHAAVLPQSIADGDRVCLTVMESDANFMCKVYPDAARRAACEPEDTLLLQVSLKLSDLRTAGPEGLRIAHNSMDEGTVLINPPQDSLSLFTIQLSLVNE